MIWTALVVMVALVAVAVMPVMAWVPVKSLTGHRDHRVRQVHQGKPVSRRLDMMTRPGDSSTAVHSLKRSLVSLISTAVMATTLCGSITAHAAATTVSREDVDQGLETIDLNAQEPKITDTCWIDLSLEGDQSGNPPARVEIGLYGGERALSTPYPVYIP